MKSKAAQKRLGRLKRKTRIRKKVIGDPTRLRLSVFRSLKHISAQIVDDEDGKTLVSATSTSKEFRSGLGDAKSKTEISAALGKIVAAKAVEKGISKVCFDRGGNAYHGRVKALADAARKEGLEF